MSGRAEFANPLAISNSPRPPVPQELPRDQLPTCPILHCPPLRPRVKCFCPDPSKWSSPAMAAAMSGGWSSPRTSTVARSSPRPTQPRPGMMADDRSSTTCELCIDCKHNQLLLVRNFQMLADNPTRSITKLSIPDNFHFENIFPTYCISNYPA